MDDMFLSFPRMSVEPTLDGSYTFEWLCHDCGWRSGDHFITSESALTDSTSRHICEEG